ncbi:hypothetical protein B0A49_05662 [Cryomyces minteri]|uniref:Uncharacterized protein n=1 Tax=Cryomyces minteri TaxID=331657 RepID=A0A4U0XGR4_9PEZI|nr:hypothetical protein B0A49_05662 [Cryomyces minteri]
MSVLAMFEDEHTPLQTSFGIELEFLVAYRTGSHLEFEDEHDSAHDAIFAALSNLMHALHASTAIPKWTVVSSLVVVYLTSPLNPVVLLLVLTTALAEEKKWYIMGLFSRSAPPEEVTTHSPSHFEVKDDISPNG